jgi:hypothetical protein
VKVGSCGDDDEDLCVPGKADDGVAKKKEQTKPAPAAGYVHLYGMFYVSFTPKPPLHA